MSFHQKKKIKRKKLAGDTDGDKMANAIYESGLMISESLDLVAEKLEGGLGLLVELQNLANIGK